MMGKTTTTGKKASKTMKRSPSSSTSSYGEGGSKVKQQKIEEYTWSDEKVGYKSLDSTKDGIHQIFKYESKQKIGASAKEITDSIEKMCELEMDVCYFFHKGFKAALKDLLDDIETCTHKVLLIHGVPKIGKSSLARCLAYYLAQRSGSASCVRMKYDPDLDLDVATENLGFYFKESMWTIVDQCNVNCLNMAKFLQFVLVNEGKHNLKMPIIMFTSGHYAPQQDWVLHRKVKYKVISVSVDTDLIDNLKRYRAMGDECSSEDVLKISNVFGHVQMCLDGIERGKVNLEEEVYQVLDIETLGRNLGFFWVLWPEFVNAKPEEIEEKNKPDDWKIDPKKVQYLSLLLTDNNDPRDKHINMIINWLNISGTESEEIEGYCSWQPDTYFYYFPHLHRLHDLIKTAFAQCSPERLYEAYLDLYHKLEQIKEANAQSIRGQIFENLLKVMCNLPSHKAGLHIVGETALVSPVSDVIEVGSVDELCQRVEKCKKEHRPITCWCILNKAHAVQFPGYDFAFIELIMGEHKGIRVQLLQVTVNPASHPTDTMKSTLRKIQRKCDAELYPCFVAPKGTAIGGKVLEYPVHFVELPASATSLTS